MTRRHEVIGKAIGGDDGQWQREDCDILFKMTALLWVLAILLVIVGLIGVVLPALPGTVLVFAGLLLAAWADHFTRVGIATIVVLGVIAAASYGVDFVAAALGARKLGASRRAMVGAGLGTIAGLFFGLPGIIVGPFIGAVIGELTTSRDLKQAGRAGAAAWIGLAIGTAVKVGIVFLMIGIFLVALFF
jgi:uncharacterized protein YqgC (DUF456 family)